MNTIDAQVKFEMHVYQLTYDRPPTINELAKKFHYSPSGMRKIVQRLTMAGVVKAVRAARKQRRYSVKG